MILSCSNIDKTFVDNHVIKNASFHIEDYEKAAIIGINGAGKSTLLKIITDKSNYNGKYKKQNRVDKYCDRLGFWILKADHKSQYNDTNNVINNCRT